MGDDSSDEEALQNASAVTGADGSQSIYPKATSTPQERAARQHAKYCRHFGPDHESNVPWEVLDDGAQYACHLTKMLFSTATQCINHRQQPVYQQALQASGMSEDLALLDELELQAKEERSKLISHKREVTKQRNAAKQDLKMEAARLARTNRRLEHELRLSERRFQKLQLQHERQVDGMKANHQRIVERLLRMLEHRQDYPSMNVSLLASQLLGQEEAGPAPTSSAASDSAESSSWTSSVKDPWAVVELDDMVGLGVNGVKPLSWPIVSEDDLHTNIPQEIVDAWYGVLVP